MFGTLKIRPVRHRPRPLTAKQKLVSLFALLYVAFAAWYLSPGFAHAARDAAALELPIYSHRFVGFVTDEDDRYFVLITRSRSQSHDLAAYAVRLYLVDRRRNRDLEWSIAGVQIRFDTPEWDVVGFNNKDGATDQEILHAMDLLDKAMRAVCALRPLCPAK